MAVTGALDIASARCLAHLMADCVTAGTTNFFFGLVGVSFIDVAGVRVLASTRRLDGCGGNVILHSASPVVRRILDLVGVGRTFVVGPADARQGELAQDGPVGSASLELMP